ncbi:TPA_asm: coat protein [ssRNA phage SRR5467090_1]|uniref:Coat protein n=1 Tax=ssRNA phage SRR5467090_1 TaxID=2786447 RepID=A0A8S5KYQ4_9VIRU|nr:coat protein [ssRNA phage SRR5467090_1]DAD50878.1 TPA_asm: coat protein [ssRNA phage SRR5467090_1]
MTWNVSTPVTGGAQTGFTSPTYTVVVDVAPDVNGKQVAVSALGGTQAGVTVHSVSSPFTATFFRPKTFAVLGKPNPVTGLLPSVPKNEFKYIVRKGVLPLAGQPIALASIDMRMHIPAGSDVADPANLRAMYSLAIGILQQQSAGLGDTVVTGIS